MSQKQIIRVKTFQGRQRIEINPQQDTFYDLKHKIAANIGGVNPLDLDIFDEDNRPLNVVDKTAIRLIRQLQEDGVMISANLKKGKVRDESKVQQQPTMKSKLVTLDNISEMVEKDKQKEKEIKDKMEIESQNPNSQQSQSQQQKKFQLTSKCTHGPTGRCINCLSAPENNVSQKNNEVKKDKNGNVIVDRSKCAHGPSGKCVNCIEITSDKDKIKKDLVKHCNHGPNSKCINCLDAQFIQQVNFKAFDQYWHERTLKCKTMHPPQDKCTECTPLENISYKVKLDCKNHLPFPKQQCVHCLPPNISLKKQPYRHVDFVSLNNVREISSFVQNWNSSGQSEQRFGWLYGYYAEDFNYPLGIRAVVEAVYEPPQIGDPSGFTLLEDPNKQMVDQVASSLGFELVGQMYTNPNNDLILSQKEIRDAANLQNQHRVRHQTGYMVSKFVTIIIRSGKQNKMEASPECYMISDQGADMERDNIFTESDSRKVLKIREPKNEMDIIPAVLDEQKPRKEVNLEWFIVKLGVGTSGDMKFNYLQHHDFPVMGRQDKDRNIQMFKKYVNKFKAQPTGVRYADFHLLTFIASLLDIHTAQLIGDCISQQKNIPQETEEFIQSVIEHQ